MILKIAGSIVTDYMAGTEWGPKNVSKGKENLVEVTRFTSGQLGEISTSVRSYLSEHPDTTRYEAVNALGQQNVKQIKRIDKGLDVLNQLSIVNRNHADLRSLIVREDLNSTAEHADGTHHLYYEIDWENAPDVKTEPVAKPSPRAGKDNKKQEPAGERQTHVPRNPAAERKQRREIAETEAERTVLEEVMFDKGRELYRANIQSEMISLEHGDDGVIKVMYRPHGIFGDTLQVDRGTGVYKEFYSSYVFRADLLRFINTEAEKLEGKQPSEYMPDNYNPDVINATYERALELGILHVGSDSQKNISFMYSTVTGLLSAGTRRIDLEEGKIVKGLFAQERPLHPQFVEFLRSKKAELEDVAN